MQWLRNSIAKLNARLEQNATFRTAKTKLWPEVEKFLIAGPVFIGFLLGVGRYAPGTPHFETAFQSLVFFAFYISGVVVVESIAGLFFDAWPLFLGVARSLLAACYLALTLKQYIEWRSGNARLWPWSANLRGRFNLSGDANK